MKNSTAKQKINFTRYIVGRSFYREDCKRKLIFGGWKVDRTMGLALSNKPCKEFKKIHTIEFISKIMNIKM